MRTDPHNHRPIAGDSPDAEAIKVLARAHQNLIWTRTRHTNALRSALREYYPAALVAFEDLAHGDALGVLGRAPSPEQGARLSLTAIQSALKRGGRQRNIAARAREIRAALGTEQLAAAATVTAAFAATTRATVGIIAELNHQISELEAALAAHFETHPDADIYLSLPGLGVVLGARVLGEFGDDPNRYTDAKSRKNYAGTSPLTVASGKKRAVLARHVRNRRLYDAIDQWAFAALSASPGARALYDQHRAAGDTHHQALRALGNRLVGILHGCLRHHTPYDEHTAWAHRHASRPLDNLRTWDLQKSCRSPFCVADSHTRWRMMADPPYQSTLRRTSVNARSRRRKDLVGLGFRTRVIAAPTLLPLPAVALRLLVAVPLGGR